MDLLQNCDLPPPLKLFPPFGTDDKKRSTTTTTTTIPKITQWDEGINPINQKENSNSLLRALQLSQSRAREAERKVAFARRENELMAAVIVEESLRVSAHRQWVKLLEMEILLLHENKKKMMKMMMNERDEEEDANVQTLTWCFTIALCLGIGLALGQYMF